MKKVKLPRTDSIQELAKFWDSHDLTDFEDELQEVTEPVFVRGTPIKVRLESVEAKRVRQIAQFEGVSEEELIRGWILKRLARWKGSGPTKRRS
ncbi:MAG TPA: CopG family antitoxin [Gemmataceae bacterium]|jgi:hypothetical protein|nr:CopG family antitoxin [Gemmataceae bacterium]